VKRWLGPALVAPAFAYIALLVGLPVVLSLYLSVSDARVGSDTTSFVGLANFSAAVRTPSFRAALAHSFLFTVVSQALVIVGATLLALSLKEAFRGRGLVRFLVLLPWVAPISLGAIGWKWLLDSLYSVVNWVLVAAGVVSAANPPMWLGEPRLAMLSVVLVHTWRTLPFATVILLAG
jgi:multiple sugar transport system permease protein